MNYSMVFFTAVGLAMDAFVIAVAASAAIKNFDWRGALKLALFCGFFQFFMPLIGWLLGSSISHIISSYDHWIAFFLLCFIGGKMIWSSFQAADPSQSVGDTKLDFKYCVTLALATSIDALAVGVTLLNINILPACSIIGIVALMLTFIGGVLGKRIGSVIEGKAELAGGIILVLIGVKILAGDLLAV